MAQQHRPAASSQPPHAPRPPKHDVLAINHQFAQQYDASKRRQLLSNAPAALLGSSEESSSSSEEEDELGELLTKRIDRQVRNTLHAIRNKHPRIYDSNATFFDDPPSNPSQDDDSDHEPVAGWDAIGEAAKRDTPKLTLKDYVRQTLLKEGRLSDTDSEPESPVNRTHTKPNPLLSANPHSHKSAQQHQQQHSDNHHDDDDDDDDGFFTKKSKTDAELQQEQQDFDAFLHKQAAKSASKRGDDFLLHSYLEKENPDQKERFLRDFVLNNGWLDSNAAPAPAAHDYDIEIDLPDPNLNSHQAIDEQDDELDDKNDQFEAAYNFRFEDPDGAQIVSHARNIPDSIRRPDERRKRAREARRLRKQQEKAAKIEDIKRLRNLKKREIQARLLAIQEAAGDQVDVSGFDLDADFDPDEFNKQMESKFGEEYYARQDEQMDKHHKHYESGARRPSLRESSSVPDDVRDDVNQMVDEYYNLNYEDIIGGAPVRFKYKKVEPESFNMTSVDILTKDDKELNQIVSLKYLAPYRSQRQVKKKAWKAAEVMKLQRSSTQTENGYGAEREDTAYQHGGDEKKTKKRKKRRRESGRAGIENVEQAASRLETHDQNNSLEDAKQSEVQSKNIDEPGMTRAQRKRHKRAKRKNTVSDT